MILQGTWSGVDLFFVISGFVISLTLIPQVSGYFRGELSAKKLILNFFTKRFFRLLPLSFLALGLNLMLAYFWNDSGQFGKWAELKNEIIPIVFNYYNYFIWLGGSSNMSWYWSLAIEEQFYAIYPAVLIFMRTNRLRLFVFLGAFALIIFWVRPFFTPPFDSIERKLWPIFTTPSHLRFDCIIAGCVAGLVFLDHAALIEKWSSLSPTITKIIAAFSIFGIATFGAILPRFEITGYPLIAVLSFVLVLIAAQNRACTPVFGFSKFLNWLGRRSYAVYLFHMIVIHANNELIFRISGQSKNDLSWIQGSVNLLLAYATTLILAEILHHRIELKFISFGRKLLQTA